MTLKEEHIKELEEEDRLDAIGIPEEERSNVWEDNGFSSYEDYYSWRGV